MVGFILATAAAIVAPSSAAAVSSSTTASYSVCKTDLDCSMNGVCSDVGVCECDAPWKGSVCGVLGYKITPASGRSLYPESDPRNTWNGAIIRGPDGVYHLYNPIYQEGTLGGTTTLLHGTATNVTGPYDWGKQPDIKISPLGAFNGPKSVVYTDPVTNKTKYSLWLGGGVYVPYATRARTLNTRCYIYLDPPNQSTDRAVPSTLVVIST